MNNEEAKIFLSQLGGKALYMLGADLRTLSDEGLKIKIKGCRTYSHITVNLNGLDLYDFKFSKISINKKTFEVKETNVKEVLNVYAEDMHGVIEKETGLYLSLV